MTWNLQILFEIKICEKLIFTKIVHGSKPVHGPDFFLYLKRGVWLHWQKYFYFLNTALNIYIYAYIFWIKKYITYLYIFLKRKSNC